MKKKKNPVIELDIWQRILKMKNNANYNSRILQFRPRPQIQVNISITVIEEKQKRKKKISIKKQEKLRQKKTLHLR